MGERETGWRLEFADQACQVAVERRDDGTWRASATVAVGGAAREVGTMWQRKPATDGEAAALLADRAVRGAAEEYGVALVLRGLVPPGEATRAEAIAAEREACARVLDEREAALRQRADWTSANVTRERNPFVYDIVEGLRESAIEAMHLARAIRARGEAGGG